MGGLELIAAVFALGAAAFVVGRKLMSPRAESQGLLASSTRTSTTATTLEETKKLTGKMKYTVYVEKEGIRLSEQGDQLFQLYQSLMKLLLMKFQPTEITFARYEQGIESSCLSISENLMNSKLTLDHLERTKDSAGESWNSQRAQANEALDSTGEAITALGNLFVSLNQINTQETHRPQLEQSIEQVQELARRAKIYSKT